LGERVGGKDQPEEKDAYGNHDEGMVARQQHCLDLEEYAKTIGREGIAFVVGSVDLRNSFGACKRLNANKRYS
jgi:hypothetical protein